ncbi:MAG: hypothetical protein KF708_24055 [Pirellulales bacterium]|nr:hypothetical protein [Pirellulales bacterium]
MSDADGAKRSLRLAWMLFGWVVTMAVVYSGLDRAREWTLVNVGQREVRTEWERWRADELVRAKHPDANVQRRPPKSAEPPLLILMRDYFSAIVVSVLLISTVMFGFLAIVVPGAIRSRGRRAPA